MLLLFLDSCTYIPRDYGTTGLRDYETTGPRDDETTRLRDYETTKTQKNAGIARNIPSSRRPVVPQKTQAFSGVLSHSQSFSVVLSRSQLGVRVVQHSTADKEIGLDG